MLNRYAHVIHRFRFVIIIGWLAITAAVYFGLPQLDDVVAHKNTQFLPRDSSVVVAQRLVKQVDPGHTSTSSAVVGIYNKDGLTQEDKTYFKDQLSNLEQHKSKYGIHSVQDPYNTDASAASKFNSQDRTVQIAVIGFPGQDVDQRTSDAMKNVKAVFQHPPQDLHVLFTGDVPIQTDQVNIALSGAAKTAGVTVALVLVILLIVFRSIVTPLVTLLSIGISFLISSNVVAWLATIGLPVSTFTKTFLIAIIFGAGTDYSIIILNRYREELGHGRDAVTAMAAGLKGISKTVIFSALTVFVSFAILFFANFGLYRTAVGVAVGIFITLVACLTFIPALILSLQGIVFWPRKIQSGAAHKPSRIWAFTGRVALRYPWWTLLVIAILFIPVGMLFTDKRTFDPMSDIPNAPSVDDFHVVAKAFGPGKVLPMDVVIKSPDNLRTGKGLTAIENVSEAISKLNSVQEVDSATRPNGKVVSQFRLTNQNQQAASGLKQVQHGLNQLSSGFGTASGQDGTRKLTDGAKSVATGASQLNQGLEKTTSKAGALQTGAQQVSKGASQLAQGATKLAAGSASAAAGAKSVASGMAQAASGANQTAAGAQKLSQAQQQVSETSSQLANAIAAWTKAHPAEATDPTWQQIEQLAQANTQASKATASAASQVSQGNTQLAQQLTKLQSGAQQVSQGTAQLTTSQQQLANAATQVASGAAQVSSGTSALQAGLSQLAAGSGQLATGSAQVSNGVSALDASLGKLGNGMSKANQALHQLSGGVSQVKSALSQSAEAEQTGNPGFYIPQSQIDNNKSLQKAIDTYVSKDGHVADIRVILKANPYAMAAIQDMPIIQQHAQVAFSQSPIHQGQVLLAGTTPLQSALNNVSSADFIRTMILVLTAIFVLLVILLRSIIAPIYIILSLAGTYFVTMGILQTFAVNVLGKAGLSWTVPFFVFLLLVALGVDYSIFLMTRFDEEIQRGDKLSVRAAMYEAMRNMGNVIFSAAVIMAGTFGSMAVAGVTSLVEIGVAVIVGLTVYAIVMLAFFVPACSAVVGNGHFWPFRRPGGSEPGESTQANL